MPRKRAVRYAWLTIKDDVQDEIFEGKYQPGDRISTVAELAAKHGVSTTTVRQAIDELASEGVLEVRQGRGTTVARPKRDYDPTRGFAEQAAELGGTPTTRVHLTQWFSPHAETLSALNLRKGQEVWQVTRLHYLNNEPIMVEVTEFLRDVAQRFMGNSRMLESIFDALRSQLGHEEWETNIIRVTVTTERVFSDLLGIPRRTTFFHIQRVIVAEDKPLFVSYLVLRSDMFQLRFKEHQGTNGTT